jgi:hypothetical protein
MCIISQRIYLGFYKLSDSGMQQATQRVMSTRYISYHLLVICLTSDLVDLGCGRKWDE